MSMQHFSLVMIETPHSVLNISAVISVQLEPNLNSCSKRPAFNGYYFHLEICPGTFVQQTFEIFNINYDWILVIIETPHEVVYISAVISVQIEPNLNSCFKRPAFNGYNFHLEICPRTFIQQTFDIFNTSVESNINPL